MKNKPVFYTEAAYVLGLIIMAFGAAFTELASFGMSMVVAPTYILHVKVSQVLPWFSFGVAEYMVQGVLVLLTVLILRWFRLFYLFSFVTALIYGTLLDAAMGIVAVLPCEAMALRLLWFAVGSLCCALAVSLFFHTYLIGRISQMLERGFEFKNRFAMEKYFQR